MAKRKTNPRRKKQLVETLDLRKVNPRGRLDVLALNAIERFAPAEIRPIVEQNREVIHATLNHNLGPHVVGFDLVGWVEAAQPYLPLLGQVVQSVVSKYQQNKVSSSDKPSGVAA